MAQYSSTLTLQDDPTGAASAFARSLSAEALLSLGSMEGLITHVVEPTAVAAPHPWVKLIPGYAMAIAITIVAYLLHELPIAPFTVVGESGVARHPVSAAIIAVLLGLLVRNTVALPNSMKAGCKSAIRTFIPIAIVLTGGGLNLAILSTVGAKALTVVVVGITIALAGGYYIGRLCKLNNRTSLLIGAGTAICGNSAIVATAPLIDAKDDDIVLSIGTVNLFGLLAMLAWPALGRVIDLGSEAFGVWAGTSIHAVPQVFAAGFAYDAQAGTLAMLVKLVRVACLAPMVFLLAVIHTRRHASDPAGSSSLVVHYARLLPWFIWGFIALSVANTLGLLPALTFQPLSPLGGTAGSPITVRLDEVCTFIATLLLTLDMAAIGLEVEIRQLVAVGGRALLAGLISTIALAAGSLVLILFLF